MPRERSDFSLKPVLLSGVALALLLLLALVGIHALTLSQAPRDHDEAAVPSVSPIGEAEFESGDQLTAFRAAELARLNGYGWLEKGVAHIPIERAMELEK